MKDIIQWVKKVGLFLFGVVLIIWGYKANANNSEQPKVDENKPKDIEKTDTVSSPSQPTEEPQTETISEPVEKKDETPKTTEKKKDVAPAQPKQETKKEQPKQEEKIEAPKTVIETTTPEESSGTE